MTEDILPSIVVYQLIEIPPLKVNWVQFQGLTCIFPGIRCSPLPSEQRNQPPLRLYKSSRYLSQYISGLKGIAVLPLLGSRWTHCIGSACLFFRQVVHFLGAGIKGWVTHGEIITRRKRKKWVAYWIYDWVAYLATSSSRGKSIAAFLWARLIVIRSLSLLFSTFRTAQS
jgi:hypothetical protein